MEVEKQEIRKLPCPIAKPADLSPFREYIREKDIMLVDCFHAQCNTTADVWPESASWRALVGFNGIDAASTM
jgi:hypothetical protein